MTTIIDAARAVVALVREDENSHGGLLSIATMRATNELDRLLRVERLAVGSVAVVERVTALPGDVHNLDEDGFNPTTATVPERPLLQSDSSP